MSFSQVALVIIGARSIVVGLQQGSTIKLAVGVAVVALVLLDCLRRWER